MVARIEDQIHRAITEQEEARRAALRAAGKRAPRTEVPKPWRRLGPQALCEDADLLSLVTEYDYDLGDKRFRAYCEARGVLHVAGERGSRRRSFFKDHGKTKRQFLSDPEMQKAVPHEGKAHRYSPEDLEEHWRIIELGRARLQDCWELWQATQPHRPFGKRRGRRSIRPKHK